MQPEPQQYPSRAHDAKVGIHWVIVLMNVWAMSLEVFTRSRFGTNYVGLRTALVYPLVLVFACCFPELDPTGLLVFLLAFLFRSGWLQWAARIREWRGREIVHSWYGGRPLLLRWMRRTDERTIKRFYEPCLCIFVGLLLMAVSPSLGVYVFLASLMVSGTTTLIDLDDRRRIRQMHDAMLEQKRLTEMLNR
jgi:hypothetical protein